MWSEIGSNFWEYTIDDNVFCDFFWMSDNFNKKFYKSGRNAIKALCEHLEVSKKVVLLPAYTCETVIQPFVDLDWNIFFYPINKDLRVDETIFINIFDSVKPSIVLYHSFFGFDTLLGDNSVKYCKEKGAIIIEDMTQSLLSGHHIEFADYYISSLRKFFAIPDGGVLISRKDLKNFSQEVEDKRIEEIAIQAYTAKERYFVDESLENKELFRKLFSEHEELINDNSVIRKINLLSFEIFSHIPVESISKKRRENYSILLDALHDIKDIEVIVDRKPCFSVPLYFPIYVKNRKAFQKYLAENRIYCPIIWPKPEQVQLIDDDTNYMYDHMICIPIDQRYGIDDMKRIISVVKEYDYERDD